MKQKYSFTSKSKRSTPKKVVQYTTPRFVTPVEQSSDSQIKEKVNPEIKINDALQKLIKLKNQKASAGVEYERSLHHFLLSGKAKRDTDEQKEVLNLIDFIDEQMYDELMNLQNYKEHP